MCCPCFGCELGFTTECAQAGDTEDEASCHFVILCRKHYGNGADILSWGFWWCFFIGKTFFLLFFLKFRSQKPLKSASWNCPVSGAMPKGIAWKYGSPAPKIDKWLIWTHLDSRHHTDDTLMWIHLCLSSKLLEFGEGAHSWHRGCFSHISRDEKVDSWTIRKSINEAACNSEISEIKGDKPPSKKAGRVVVTRTGWSFCFTWHNSQKDG